MWWTKWTVAAMLGLAAADGTGDQALGLGPFWSPSPQVPLPLRPIPPSQVVVPSDMFAILDARRITDTDGVAGWPFMPGHFLKYDRETQRLRHGKGFNFLFCDGHVMTIRRTDFMSPTNSWQNWNNDHKPHKENWPR